MTIHILSFALALAATAPATQTGSTGAASTTPKKPALTDKTLTLNGCVLSDDAKPEQFNLTSPADDKGTATTYRLSGMDVRAYRGKRVQIMGGLVPSPNIAAQAGAIDVNQAAITARTPGATVSTPPLPEFRIEIVKRLAGPCPQP